MNLRDWIWHENIRNQFCIHKYYTAYQKYKGIQSDLRIILTSVFKKTISEALYNLTKKITKRFLMLS